MDVRLPDGTVVQNIPDGTSKADLAAKLKANGMNVPDAWLAPSQQAAPEPSLADHALNVLKGYGGMVAAPLETAGHLASGFVGKVAGDVAGLGAIPAHALGLTDTDPAQVQQSVQNGLTYDPRTQMGKDTVGAINGIVGNTLGALSDKTGKGYGAAASALGANQDVAEGIQHGVTEAINQAPGFLGLKSPGFAAKVAATPALSEAAAATLKDANSIGIRVTPEYAGMNEGITAKTASMSGSETKLQQALSKHNAQGPVPEAIRQDLGITDGKDLTQASLDANRKGLNAVYETVKKQGAFRPDGQLVADMDGLGVDSKYKPKQQMNSLTLEGTYAPKDSAGIVNDITQLRADYRAGKLSDDPATVRGAKQSLAAANALEDFLQRSMERTNPGLAKALPAARQGLAKLNSVEDAFNEANGTVDVKQLAKDLDNGVPLSGNLKKLALAYKAFPKVLQDPAKINVGSGSMIDKALQVGGVLHGNPLEIAAGVARPAARARVNTDAYQAGMVNPPIPGNPLNSLAKDPRLAALLASLSNSPGSQR